MSETKSNPAPLAVSMGDPAGIGPDIILQAFQEQTEHTALPDLFVIGDPDLLEQRRKSLGISDIAIRTVGEVQLTGISQAKDLKVLPLSGSMSSKPGQNATSDGSLVIEAIDRAVALTLDQKASGIVTCPINKKALYEAGFSHPGHTEYLAHLAEQALEKSFTPVMMLAGPELRTVPVTIHIPLSEVVASLTTELIIETCRITAHDLQQRFGISKPRLALSGLNPHAGEQGAMGNEDMETIVPAVKSLKADGIDAVGPLPADTMFHARARREYDVAICMYHDQALIPAKTLAFDEAVNVTLGLPFIRTSPDHGTAYDIAGKGIANPSSFVAAVKMAAEMAEKSASGGA